MKRFILLFTLTISSITVFAQDTHTLTAIDHYFSPDTLYVQQGDTIELNNIGYHSATEVDSLDWVNNNANHNGGFYVGFGAPTSSMKFTLEDVGTYYNICLPHAGMGMKSIIIVEPNTTNINEVSSKGKIQIFPNPASNSISVQNTSTIQICNMTGQILYTKRNLNDLEQIDISFLPRGVYNVILDGKKERLIVQ